MKQGIDFPTYIKNIREYNKLTQEYVAEKVGVSRVTYMNIEKGQSELSISEANKLAELYDINVLDLLNCQMPDESRINITINSTQPSQIDVKLNQDNVEKFKDVLLYILEKVGAKPNVGETVIYKLLYFIDFDYYEKYQEKLIGATYIKNNYGPTPVAFKKIVDKMIKNGEITQIENEHFKYKQKKYLPLKKPSLKNLTAQEVAHIDWVLQRLSDRNATDLSDYSHKDTPWVVAKDKSVIKYDDVLERTPETSVKNI